MITKASGASPDGSASSAVVAATSIERDRAGAGCCFFRCRCRAALTLRQPLLPNGPRRSQHSRIEQWTEFDGHEPMVDAHSLSLGHARNDVSHNSNDES